MPEVRGVSGFDGVSGILGSSNLLDVLELLDVALATEEPVVSLTVGVSVGMGTSVTPEGLTSPDVRVTAGCNDVSEASGVGGLADVLELLDVMVSRESVVLPRPLVVSLLLLLLAAPRAP